MRQAAIEHHPTKQQDRGETDTLEKFRLAQRLAYECAETIARELRPGVTERDAAVQMKVWLQDHGVNDWFHQPFAWFGDRTAFRGFDGFHPGFYPSRRRLEENMPYIWIARPCTKAWSPISGIPAALATIRFSIG